MGKQEEADLAGRLANVENNYLNALCSGNSGPKDIGLLRRTWEIMNDDWTTKRQGVLNIYGMPSTSRLTGPKTWQKDTTNLARREVMYENIDPQMYAQQVQNYGMFGGWMKSHLNNFFESVKNNYTGEEYILEANPLTPDLVDQLDSGFMEWFNSRPVTAQNLSESAPAAFWDFLAEQPYFRELLFLILALPPRSTPIEGEANVPFEIEALETLISFVPIVGNIVAAYEVGSGQNLFGYKLSPLDRSIIAVTLALPLAGRLFRGGRAIYTEARLVRLYGRDAAYWNKMMKAGARSLEEQEASRIVQKANNIIRLQQKLDAALADDALKAVPKLLHSPGIVLSFAEDDVKALFQALLKQYPILLILDENALQRILCKIEKAKIQGVLLEELAASHTVPWLKSRQVGFALGVKVPEGAALEYIPGYRLRAIGDDLGWDITDGIMAYYSPDKRILNIVAIFEAKSGKNGPRELFKVKKSWNKLSQDERNQAIAHAKEEWVQRSDQAQKDGKPYVETVEEIAIKFAQDDTGQIERDIARLEETADGELQTIRVDGKETVVKLVKNRGTRIFAIVPKGVRTNLIEDKAKKLGYRVEALGVPLTRKDLQDIAKKLLPLAQSKLSDPPK